MRHVLLYLAAAQSLSLVTAGRFGLTAASLQSPALGKEACSEVGRSRSSHADTAGGMKMLRDLDQQHHHSIGQLAHKLRTVCSASRVELSKLCHSIDAQGDLWSTLPPACLEHILVQLSTSAQTFAAVRLVCKAWRDASNECVGSLSPLVCYSHVIVSRWSNLEQSSFRLCGATLNLERLAVICRLKRLRTLILPHTVCRVGDWPSALRQSTSLRFLIIDECLFKRTGVRQERVLPCQDTQIDGAYLKRIAADLPQLQGLDVGCSYSLTGHWLDHILGHFSALVDLEAVSKAGRESPWLRSLGQLPHSLTNLRLGPVHPSTFDDILRLTSLQRLGLVGRDLDRLPLTACWRWHLLTNLTELSFSCYDLCPGLISSLPTTLRSLSFSSTSISYPSAVLAHDLAAFTNLQRLQLHLQCRISPQNLPQVLTELHEVVESSATLPHLSISFSDHEQVEELILSDTDRPIRLASRGSVTLGLPCAKWKPVPCRPKDSCSITSLCFDPGVSLDNDSAVSIAGLRTLQTLQVSLAGGIPSSFAALLHLQHLSVSWDHQHDDLYEESSPASKPGSNAQQHQNKLQGPTGRHRFRLLHRSRSNSALAPSVSVVLQLRSLESLHLAHPAFGDEDLRQIGTLTRLTELVFMQSAPEPCISSAGLLHLSGRSLTA